MRPNGGIIHIQKVIGVGYPHKISKYGVNIDKIYYNELLETLDALLISVSLDIFYDYFSEFTDQYVLIGGAACDLSFRNNDLDFRATDAEYTMDYRDFFSSSDSYNSDLSSASLI